MSVCSVDVATGLAISPVLAMPIACCSALRATPLTASIGAVVDGVDLADLRPGPALVELRHLLDRHQVLFFQQQHLDTLGLLGLSERFGRPTIHPVDRLVASSRSVSTIVDSAEHPPARASTGTRT